ncbi:MAG: hypothetical protein K8W52_10300 [Deltaproteobacteria bacterium]|nr:hypothetical protein [Deltaproteobacteria bacterium]
MTRIKTPLLALVLLLLPAVALADVADAADDDDDASLAWQLRPVTNRNLARIASAAAAFNDGNGNLDLAIATTWTGTYRLSDAWAPMVRLGLVGNNAPGAALDGSAFANPLVGATYTRRLGRSHRLALFGAATLPVGTGNARTHAASMTALPSDRAMFDVDAMAAIAGVDVAYVRRGFTAQAEATLVQSVRVRGPAMATATRTRAAVGAHLGYLVGWHVAVGADLHYEDTLTAAVGVRMQFRVGKDTWIRPGLAYLRGLDRRGLDAPLLTAHTTAVQFDLPMTF